MAKSPDQPLMASETAQQIVDAAVDECGFRVLWRQDSSCATAPAGTTGMPRCSKFAERLIWWPHGVCELRRVSLISSRIGAHHDQYRWWYDLLRTAVLRVDVSCECLVAVPGTSTGRAVARSAELFGLPCLTMHVDDGTASSEELVDWLLDCVKDVSRRSRTGDAHSWLAFLSPGPTGGRHRNLATVVPARDELSMRFGERVYALACRDGGHVDRLLQDALTNDTNEQRLICLADSAGTAPRTFASLCQMGAVAWLVDGISTRPTEGSESRECRSKPLAVLSDGPLTHPELWLCHWTRPREGPWPGQPEVDFLDELILGCETADRSALAALLQIINRQMIVGSDSTVSGEIAVVSFTEVPLAEFRRRRVWRRHRRRYDFEPWGIAIRRNALESKSCRPVIYGQERDRLNRSAEDRIWFQPSTDRSGRIDWSQEREWRLLGDVGLADFPVSSICVFVESAAEAAMVSEHCSWSVIATAVASA